MNGFVIVFIILVILAAATAIRVTYELKTLTTTEYTIESHKENKGTRIVFLADLHNRNYGKENRNLIQAVRNAQPDFIIFAGDMVTASKKTNDRNVIILAKKISEIAPTFYVPGNHEKKLEENTSKYGHRYNELVLSLRDTGIHYLDGKSESLNNCIIYGLNLPLEKYKNSEKINSKDIAENIGEFDKNQYNILVAHSPRFFMEYAEAGADLVLSGHYHGGAVRIPGGPGIISPQCVLFPKYSVGKFKEGNTTMVVTAGCGTHSVNLRLFNKPEIVVINIV